MQFACARWNFGRINAGSMARSQPALTSSWLGIYKSLRHLKPFLVMGGMYDLLQVRPRKHWSTCLDGGRWTAAVSGVLVAELLALIPDPGVKGRRRVGWPLRGRGPQRGGAR